MGHLKCCGDTFGAQTLSLIPFTLPFTFSSFYFKKQMFGHSNLIKTQISAFKKGQKKRKHFKLLLLNEKDFKRGKLWWINWARHCLSVYNHSVLFWLQTLQQLTSRTVCADRGAETQGFRQKSSSCLLFNMWLIQGVENRSTDCMWMKNNPSWYKLFIQ